jgi:hypothetical protein
MSRNVRTSLLIGVSVIALTVALPDLGQAADLPTKAPTYQPAPQVTWWIEGGPEWTGGPSVAYVPGGFFPVGQSIKAGSGWSIAGGFDYRFAASPWHVSADVRYGKAGSRSQSFISSAPPVFFSSSSASHKEDHWVADFMVGRDIGLGTQSQVKLGVRVADLRATTDVSSAFAFFIFFGSSSFEQRSRFLGVGPRAALDGTAQIQGPWSIDYNAGIALLYGNRELNLSGSGTGTGGPFTFNTSDDSNGWVPNANGSLALGYSFTPGLKISAGYQIDYYWNALRTFDVNGNAKNIDRNYSGPFVRVSGSF